jgi:AcrR family transcriptional regulator
MESTMPKISAARRDQRRQQILEAALACFSEQGFHQTGMAMIVERSGLSHGAVYGYFASKDDIIEALADDRHQREALLNAAGLDVSDPLAGLLHLIRAYAHALGQPDALPGRRVGVHGWSEALRNDRVKARVVAGIEAPRAAMIPLIEGAQAAGQITRSVEADALARSLIALFQGFVLQTVWGEPFAADDCLAVVERMVAGLNDSVPGAAIPGRSAPAP